MTIALIWVTCSWPGIKEKKPSDFTVRARWTVMHNVWSQWSSDMDLVQKLFFFFFFTPELVLGVWASILYRASSVNFPCLGQSVDVVRIRIISGFAFPVIKDPSSCVCRSIMTPPGMSRTPPRHHAWRRAASWSWPSEWPKGNSRWENKPGIAQCDGAGCHSTDFKRENF